MSFAETKMARSESRSNERNGSGAWLLAGLAAGAAGSIVAYFASQRRMDRALRELRRELRAEVASAVAKLETPASARESSPADANLAEELSEDVILLIASAVTAHMGKNVRIRSAQRLQPLIEKVTPWAQQGRAFLQSSHNIAQTRPIRPE
jgi:hypothetical protein